MGRDLTQALTGAAVALGRTREPREVVRVAVAETRRAAGVDAVALHLLNARRELLLLREFAGATPALWEQMVTLPLTEAPVAATVIRELRVVTCAVDQYPTLSLRDQYASHGFRYVSAVPVAGREQSLGVLRLASQQEPPLTAQEGDGPAAEDQGQRGGGVPFRTVSRQDGQQQQGRWAWP